MKNILNTIKYFPIIVLAIFLFSPAKQSFALTCWTDYGPEWMNCNNGDNDNDDDDDNDDDNDNDDNDNLNVSTLSATNIDEDSATLRGDITDLDESEDYERYFEWGTDDDDLDRTATISGTTDDEGTFSRTISGLSDDKTYYYRACAEEDDGGDEDCGSIRSFRTDEDNSNDDDDDDDNDDDNDNDGSVLTTDATAITTNSAVLNGVVFNDGGSQRVWFEYGRTTSLGNTTSSRNVSGDQSAVSIDLTGLSSSQSYFFRIVSSNGEKGDIRSLFTKSVTNTGGTTPTTTTPTTTPTITVNSGEYLNVDLVSNVKDARSGEAIVFEVIYENLTIKTLKSIRILIDFPEGITPKKTDLGTFLTKQQIEVIIPTLSAKTKGHFTIVAEVDRNVSNNEFLVSVIEANYDHPITPNTSINTIDYSILKVVGGNTDQAAGALFALGLLGISFWGWLIIFLLIALIIWFAHKLSKENKKAKEEEIKKELQISK